MRIFTYSTLKTSLRISGYLVLCLALTLTSSTISYALEAEQKKLFKDQIQYFNFRDEDCGIVAGANVDASASQVENAKIVMGIAKTYNLGREGALVGLMTALVESNLKVYASSNVPVSQQNPAWLALPEPRPLGNDHDSVGIMQQRVSSGWSTFGNIGGNPAGNPQDVAWQLMDAAYAAQAFFGTPPGAVLPEGLVQPSALKKGLQNLPGDWRSMGPGQAAQAVQISARPDAYDGRRAEAESLLNQHWDAAPPIPLPIPVTGGTAEAGVAGDCPVSGGGNIRDTIFTYAWPDYKKKGTAGARVSKQEYVDATRAARANGKNEYIGDLCGSNLATSNEIGVDCGAFVTRVMRDSGADPEYNKYECNTICQIRYLNEAVSAGKYTIVSGSEPLELGDIALNDGHTYFYVGAMTGPNGEAFNGDSASASQCNRAPMAGPNDERSKYTWYRLNQVAGD